MLEVFFQNSSPKQTVVKNTFWLLTETVVNKLLKFFLIIWAARILGAAGYGAFSFALSFAATIFIFADLGIGSILIREYQKEQNRILVSTALWLKLILSLISILVGLVVLFFFKSVQARPIILILLLMDFILNFRDGFIAFARARQKMEEEAFLIVLENIVVFLIGFLVLFFWPTALNFSLAYFAGALISFLAAFIVFQKRAKIFSRNFDPVLAKKILRLAWPFTFGSLIAVTLGSIDTLMLGLLKTAAVVGIYSAAIKIVYVLSVIPGIIVGAIFPLISRFHQDEKVLLKIIREGNSALLLLALPLTLGGFLIGGRLIHFFLGSQYLASVLIFKVLIFLVPLIFLVSLWDSFLLAVNLQIKDFEYTAVAAALNVILNFILIPEFFGLGAAVAILISQFVNFVLTYRLTRAYFKKTFKQSGQTQVYTGLIDFKLLAKYIFATLVMTVFVFTLTLTRISSFVIIFLAIFIYFGALLLTREEFSLSFVSLVKRKFFSAR